MDNPQATDFELGWFAGIVDGEGWLGMTIYTPVEKRLAGTGQKRKVKVELKITNCDEAIILKTAHIMRKMGVNPYLRTQGSLGPGRRLVHECATKHMTTVERILIQIREHLIGIKRERAEIILRFIELRRANEGSPNPAYGENGDRPGKHGMRTIFPYTEEELALVERCRELQSRGASETTREDRDKAVKALRSDYARQRSEMDAVPDMI
jgi:hypothetical protein